MNFCGQCGNRLIENESTCSECGAELVRKSASHPVDKPPPARYVSKTKKIGAGSLLLAGVLLFALYQFASNASSPMATVDEFWSAVEANDIKGIQATMMTTEETGVSDSQAEWILEQLTTNEYMKEWLEEDLRQQVIAFQGSIIPEEIESGLGGLSLSYEQTGKRWLFFDDYSLILHPEELIIYLEHEEDHITVDHEQVAPEWIHDHYYSLGSYYPDVYDVAVVLDTAFGSHEFNQTVNHNGEETVFFTYETDAVDIHSTVMNAELYLNDEPTDIVLSSGSETFDPVLYDSSITLHGVADTPFGEVQSLPLTLDDEYLVLVYPAPEAFQDEMLQMLYDRQSNGRFLDEIQSNEQPRILTEVAIANDSVHLMQDSDSSDWSIYAGYRETWSEGDPETGMDEFINTYEAEFLFSDSSGEWFLEELWYMSSYTSSDWHTMSYDRETQLNYYHDLVTAAEKDIYLEDPYYYTSQLINNFHYESVYLNNGGDASFALAYIHDEASAYQNSVTEYAEYLQGRNITQDFEGSSIISFTEDGNDVYRVITEDQFQIHNHEAGTSRRALFETEYELILTGDGFFITNLLDTEEVWSEDQSSGVW